MMQSIPLHTYDSGRLKRNGGRSFKVEGPFSGNSVKEAVRSAKIEQARPTSPMAHCVDRVCSAFSHAIQEQANSPPSGC